MQRRIAVALFLIVLASRFAAISRSITDWDEALFAQGVLDYDVTRDHPHAPGYPLFILAAKVIHLFGVSEFRALQAIATLASILLFPAVLMLARELRMRDSTALIAATMTAFLPTVWYYGGTALSDVPALCASLAGAAFLLRGGRSERAYWIGALLVAIAVGIRPQMILIAIAPAALGAIALRNAQRATAAVLMAVMLIAASYGGAMLFSDNPPFGYWKQLRQTQKHIAEHDSLRNPSRPPLQQLIGPAFREPGRGGDGADVLLAFAIVGLAAGLIRRRAEIWIVLAMFVPLALITWVMLDATSLARYSIAYVAMYTLLAADGIAFLASLARRWESAIATSLAFIVTGLLIVWVWPALRDARETEAPVVSAMNALRASPPRTIYVENELAIYAEALLREVPHKIVYERTDFAPDANRFGNVFVVGRRSMQPGAQIFSRRKGRLAKLARPYFFDVSVIPMHSMIEYVDGWYDEESMDATSWRWMKAESLALLPPARGRGELRMNFLVPLDLLPRAPLVTITWNGTVIERGTWSSAEVTKTFTLGSRLMDDNELRIHVDVVGNPKRAGKNNDDRDLALMLRAITWQ